MGAVNLDGVEPGRLGADDCIAELLGDRCDLVGGHGVELRLHVGATRRAAMAISSSIDKSLIMSSEPCHSGSDGT